MTFQLRNTEIGLILRKWALFGKYLIWSSSARRSAGGKFKVSWKLPVASSKGAECPLQVVHERFHVGFNDITRHIKPIHQQRFKDSSSNIVSMVGQPSQLSHSVQYQFFLILSWIKLPVKLTSAILQTKNKNIDFF